MAAITLRRCTCQYLIKHAFGRANVKPEAFMTDRLFEGVGKVAANTMIIFPTGEARAVSHVHIACR